jgi:hypothetical protein
MRRSSNSDFEAELLTESKTLRDKEIAKASEDQTQRILNKVKQLYFAVWDKAGRATRQQVANFYEVPVETVDTNFRRHKEEFLSDGVKVVSGEDLRELRFIMNLSSSSPKETIYTPRGVLRMGFILRDSAVARQVRDVALNIIEGVGRLLSRDILEDLLNSNPSLQVLVEQSDLTISVPLAPYWDAMKRKLKKLYPTGGIPGMSTKDIRDKVAALSTYIGDSGWEVRSQKELRTPTASNRVKYPDFSICLPVNVEGKQERAIFMFLFDNLIVEYEDIEKSAGRNYIRLAKSFPEIDYAFLFFVAPFGATPDAEIYLRQEWPAENERGFVGILTVKELSELLVNQARKSKRSNLIKGEIKRDFKKLFDYHMPDPLLIMADFPPFSSNSN